MTNLDSSSATWVVWAHTDDLPHSNFLFFLFLLLRHAYGSYFVTDLDDLYIKMSALSQRNAFEALSNI